MTRVEELEAFIETMRNRHAHELAEKERAIEAWKEQLKKTEYAFKGACCEHVTVRVELTPEILASGSDYRALHSVVAHASKRVANEVEHQLGSRYDLHTAYDAAISYIHYLQDHAASRGVQFMPFAMKEFK